MNKKLGDFGAYEWASFHKYVQKISSLCDRSQSCIYHSILVDKYEYLANRQFKTDSHLFSKL